MNDARTVGVFIADYTIDNSPSLINLIDLLARSGQVDVYLLRVAHATNPVLARKTVRVLDYSRTPGAWAEHRRLADGYDDYVGVDPHGFVMCRELFPLARPVYYSLELYMSYDHTGLDYPEPVRQKERDQIHEAAGLIIQSEEKARLFRADYALADTVPTFILPVTYQGPADPAKSDLIRRRYGISADQSIALHLGGIAPWFSCAEIAGIFSGLPDWVLFFQGYPDKAYARELQNVLDQKKVANVILTDRVYDSLEEVDGVIRSCDVGIAWYNDISIGFRTNGQSSGKIPGYMRFGLPVIAKAYPSTRAAIADPGAGLCVDDYFEIPAALAAIRDDHAGFSRRALAEYERTYRFENHEARLLAFIRGEDPLPVQVGQTASRKTQRPDPPLPEAATHHFNWDRLMKNRKVDDFLASDELWGAHQNADNPGRRAWRRFLGKQAEAGPVKILEIGFGSGIDYRAAEKEGLLDSGRIEYHGADVTKTFVENAKTHFERLTAHLIDGYKLPFEDNSFDLVYLRHVFEHQIHYQWMLGEILRVCRGQVFVNFFIPLSDDHTDRIDFDGTWHHNTYSRQRFCDFAQARGFVVREVERFTTGDKTDQLILLTPSNAAVRVDPYAGPVRTRIPSEKSLNIVHTVEFYHPHLGGAELVVQQVSERLVRRGHRVTVATTEMAVRETDRLNGVEIAGFAVKGALGRRIAGPDVERYRNFLLTCDADVVMNYAAQQWATDLAFETVAATAGRRVNLIAPCGYSALDGPRTLRWPAFADYFERVIPQHLPFYDAAIYHSARYQDHAFADDHGFTNSVVIPNGVDMDEFDRPLEVDFRETYGITTRYFGLCVANYLPGKGQDRVIDCVRGMGRNDFSLVCIGKEGGEQARLEQLAQGVAVIFLQDIPRAHTVAAFHGADLFIFGSRIEAAPLVIIEAMAAATPFVSTDCGNVAEMAGGVVCAPEAMAENANRLLDDPGLRAALAQDGHRQVREELNWESVTDRYEALYQRLHHAKTQRMAPPPPETAWCHCIEDLDRRIDADPGKVALYLNAARILVDAHQPDEARKYMEDALELDPDHVEAHSLSETIGARP
ncbi:MAG: glycosyltransferase [Desulfobacterales bacterium]|nr:glycosyltransferase [Desulfobacterales bacterium]